MKPALLAALALFGCAQPAEQRDRANAAAAKVALDSTLTVRAFGGAIVESGIADSVARVRVRAQSLDTRIDVLDTGCAPRVVEITVTHLPATGIEASWTPLLDALALEVIAAREAGGGAVDFVGDPHDRDRTPLDRRHVFEPAAGVAADVRRWWVTTDRGRQRVTVENAAPAGRAEPTAACVTTDTDAAGPLGRAALVTRHRLHAAPTGDYMFAVWGNNAGDSEARARLMTSVNARQPRFAIISGDLTSEGRPGQIRAAVDQLDRGLAMPWFATVGDRDVAGELTETLVEELGRTSFVMDVGVLRIAVLDSGDKALSPEGHRALDRWLDATKPLWWAGEAPPAQHLVITHVPPFDPHGSRGDGFNQRLEAGRVMAELRRAAVPYLLTSQFATWKTVNVAGVDIVHSGGAGAPIEGGSDAPHHWVAVHVSGQCLDTEAWLAQTEDGPCGGRCDWGQICVDARCQPCVTLERVAF